MVAPALFLKLGSSPFLHTIGLTWLYLASGAVLLLTLHAPPATGVSSRLLAAIGANSYSIYLWHMPIRFWLVEPLRGTLDAGYLVPVYLLTSIGGGILMARLVEWPFLAMRDRWFAVRRTAVEAGVPDFAGLAGR